MIELIFVIVILGILAAVAIPRLTATRDDANIAKGLTEVQMAISDFGAYYTAQGEWADEVSKMTNVANFDNVSVNAKTGGVINYQTAVGSDKKNCVKITFAGNGTLLFAKGDKASESPVCTEMLKDRTLSATMTNSNISFGGTGIKRD
jgi:general secretion pathway protein G